MYSFKTKNWTRHIYPTFVNKGFLRNSHIVLDSIGIWYKFDVGSPMKPWWIIMLIIIKHKKFMLWPKWRILLAKSFRINLVEAQVWRRNSIRRMPFYMCAQNYHSYRKCCGHLTYTLRRGRGTLFFESQSHVGLGPLIESPY
jgi:hypothetical protein